MTAAVQIKHGDFSNLAENYSLYRPGYSETVVDAALGIVGKAKPDIDFADIGAGTGIWTRMVASKGLKNVTAVEPNDFMRKAGAENADNNDITWQKGSGESTGLSDESQDLVTMASSFHWVDFEKGTQEFARILRPQGCFMALWNPRVIDDNPLFIEIENEITRLSPDVKRVSSGKSDFVDTLSKKLMQSPYFKDLTYIEAQHTSMVTPEQYIGAWNSVNDIRHQLGEDKFSQFMEFVKKSISHLDVIPCKYLTRAWIVKKK